MIKKKKRKKMCGPTIPLDMVSSKDVYIGIYWYRLVYKTITKQKKKRTKKVKKCVCNPTFCSCNSFGGLFYNMFFKSSNALFCRGQ